MKYFLVRYCSKNNLFQGSIAIQAKSLHEAQDKFFAWLREQEVYKHMWRLEIEIEELEGSI